MSRLAAVLLTLACTASHARATKAELPAPDDREPRLGVYGVTTTGALDRDAARRALWRYRDDPLKGCRLPRTERYGLRGRSVVEARVRKDGRLTVVQIKGTDQHAGLESCLRKRIERWKLGQRPADAGTLVRFKIFISFTRKSTRVSGVLGALRGSSTANVFGAAAGSSGLGYGRGGGGYGAGGLGVHGAASGRSYYKSSARLGDVRASGALSQSVISWGLGQQSLESSVRYCHQSAARSDEKLAKAAGELQLALRVDTQGAIDRVEVKRSTISDAKLRACVLGKVLRSTFPEAQGSTEISLKLIFPKPEKRSY